MWYDLASWLKDHSCTKAVLHHPFFLENCQQTFIIQKTENRRLKTGAFLAATVLDWSPFMYSNIENKTLFEYLFSCQVCSASFENFSAFFNSFFFFSGLCNFYIWWFLRWNVLRTDRRTLEDSFLFYEMLQEWNCSVFNRLNSSLSLSLFLK